jgi:hypothetical protein
MNSKVVWGSFTCVIISLAYAILGALIESVILCIAGIISATTMTIVTVQSATEYGIIRNSKLKRGKDAN